MKKGPLSQYGGKKKEREKSWERKNLQKIRKDRPKDRANTRWKERRMSIYSQEIVGSMRKKAAISFAEMKQKMVEIRTHGR